MNKTQLRRFMILEKQFLGRLYKSNAIVARKELSMASTNQIKLVIYICHFITCGSIPVTSKGLEALKIGKRGGFLHKTFVTKASTNRLLKAMRKDQLTALFKISSCFNYLLHSIFTEPTKEAKKQPDFESMENITKDIIE